MNLPDARNLVLHTDIGRFGLPDGVDRGELPRHHYEKLKGATDATLVFPTFNYSFPDTGVYDIDETPCEVGALNEWVRNHEAAYRTLTPIFHFALDRPVGPTGCSFECFGPRSSFGRFVDTDTALVFYGAPLSADTHIHRAEDEVGVPYRYRKRFRGHIVWGGDTYQVELVYRVRPPGEAVQYDWERIEERLISEGVLHRQRHMRGWMLWCDAEQHFRALVDWLGSDPHALLTDDSRARVEALYRQHGRPLATGVEA